METDTEQEYSEIVEMSTFSTSKILEAPLDPSSLSETYITMDGTNGGDGPSHATPVPKQEFEQGEPSTFRKYSVVDDPGAVHYENYAFASPERFVSTEDIIPRRRHLSDGSEPCDDTVSLRVRLKYKKRRYPFWDYATYAMDSVYEEVEKIAVLDIAFLLFAAITFGIGIANVDECRASPRVPVVMSVCGGVDVAANSFSLAATLTRRRPLCRECMRDVARAGRLILFFMHLYGLSVVYSILPPDEVDIYSPEYCHPTVFWVAFAFFHLTSLASITVLVGMVIAALCFFV